MIVDKNIPIDLNRVQPLKTLHVHEGDVNSVRLVLSLTKDAQDVDLTNITVKYDAVIAGHLAEQNANGSVEDGKVIIPLTANMTIMGGILKVDVKLIEGTAVLFTQTIKLLVDRSVIDGDTIIDISGTTIGQQLEAFRLQLDGFVGNHYTKAETDTLLNSYYTKTEANNLLNGKMKYEYHQGVHAEDLDTYTDAQTIYRIYYEGTYQFLVCTSGTGGQYRFTKFGDVYYRVYNMGNNTWGEWKTLGAIADNSLSGAKLTDGSVSGTKLTDGTVANSKLSDTYFRLFTDFNLNNAYSIEETGIYKGTAPSTWQFTYEVSGDFILYHDVDRQILYFNTDNRTFIRTRSGSVSDYSWNSWVEITPITESRVNTLISNQRGSYYTKSEADTKFDNRLKVVTKSSATLSDCDTCTDPGTLYRLYIGGLYQLLLNTSNTGGQFRFTRDGNILYRTYNTGNNTWSDWAVAFKNIPNGVITEAMLDSNFLLSYDNIEDEYIRYFDITSASEFDTLYDYGIYTGTSDNVWTSHYNATGNFILLVLDENQVLFFPDCNKLFARIRPINGTWQTWTDISPITQSQVTTIAGNVADSKLANYYTQSETNTRLNNKVNYVINTSATLSDCDNCYLSETIYRLIINGHEHLIINAGTHGTQYRFTEGHVYYRSYSGGAWGSWQDLLTLIPNNTITTDMIQSGAVTANELEEGYMRAFSGEDLTDINNWDAGIYTGELGENWRARYGYTGHYIVIAEEIQLMIIPEVQRIRYRYRNYARIWGDWIDIDFVTLEDVNNAVHGESGTIGTNYAWYTDQSQGLSLTGTYTLIGDFCTINGTCPLIEGWNTVYYSLPCASLYSAATIARCGSAVLSVVTNTLNNVSVLEIKKLDGGALPSGTISFTLTYRYQQYE